MIQLNEADRRELISKSKNSYKGKQRFNRRNKSKVVNTVKAMNSIDMNKLFKEDILTVNLPIKGETDDYVISVTFGGFLEILRDQVKGKDEVDFRDISRACIIGFDKTDVFIHCTCPDFCLHEDTDIKLLNGEVLPIKEIFNKFNNNEELWTYSVDENGDFKPGKIINVWISGLVNDFVKVTLDNGKEILTTPEHRYMLRNGEFIEAKDLKENVSLMPLYFSYHDGYESVKLNSIYDKTIFRSVYKLISDELLTEEIEEAKKRSKEDIIQIHHKDFNKLNNYPSNLYPMGKNEHWKYHYTHLYESGNFDKWQQGGKNYWEKESSRKKQSQVMHEVMSNYYSQFTSEEISQQRRAAGAYSDEWKNKISESNKKKWSNYSEEEYLKRCEINKESNNRPNAKKKQSERRKQYYIDHPEHRDIARNNLKKAVEKIKGVPFTEDHKRKISEACKKMSLEKKQEKTKNIRDTKIRKILTYMFSNGIELTFDNYCECMKLPQYYHKGYPYIGKYFNNEKEVIEYFNLENNFNHKVKKVEFIHLDESVPVYDLTVDKYNNFYVDAGVILHNCYRFGYWATQNNYDAGPVENRPSNITNPHDTLGSSCKHVLLILNNNSWILKVASAINNYIRYIRDHYEKLYADIIYPAIYGKPYEEPVQLSIEDEIEDEPDELMTDTDTLDTANEYNKNRTRFQKGNTQGIRFAPKEDETQISIEDEENIDDII